MALKFIINKLFNKQCAEHPDVIFDISGLKIVLPHGHDLPTYKKKFPLYDAFLGHLAKFLPNEHLVIDVGANVGDTVAAMSRSNPRLAYLCIEADDYFFDYLEQNIIRIKSEYPNIDITTCKALAGMEIRASSLIGGSRTKRIMEAKDDETAIPTKSIDHIYYGMNNKSPLTLLKVDVDGYDYDVINSAMGLLSNSNAYVYFECDLQTENALADYKDTLERLYQAGYNYFSVFDNYGSPMTITQSVDTVCGLINYTYKQNKGELHRTMYYLDVLCFKEERFGNYKHIRDTYNINSR